MSHLSKNRIAGVAAALTLMLATTACHAGGGKIDACKLVSAAEAGKILGTQVTIKPQDTSLAGPDAGSICHYLTGSLHGGFTLGVAHTPYKNGDAATELADRKKEMLDDYASSGMAKPTFTDVNGLGEAATLLKAQDSFQLHVLAHHTVMGIVMIRKASPEAVAQAEKLARVALGNLK